ncbi:hypothetical protein PNX04_18910 [[Ruminococcus] gnavus]|uniref:Uncharacterized protein n=3 Tax=Mediterraneibacter gnavus TaxID=33038 RepID=A0A3E4UVZ9_MEDGN|nr:hypothetical protein [Mediterraneibacter gnavus]RJW19325.1 hypothetical protein DXD70_13645 [Lachnospiraceae bacterium TM07-2AC]MDB8698319.1 hypothetical protein [Mediterraneibacter gnavus]MDB8709022.1 hypothetical protein [Mediterraneibacter gnavus]PLT60493.1 hypothetical protein CCY17_14195 [Mediterraneibacter gnavus]RGM17307.1 hypothetical protein DXC31_16425 [Mediterraneibacter gnavus]
MRKRIGIMMAAMILLCGILTGIGIFLVVLKQEKLPEQKPEKVKQELQKKSEETLEDPKQKPEETEPEKEAEEQAEEPLSMELSGLNEEALSMMGISKREVADALRTWTQEHGFSSATGAQFMEPMLVRFSEEKYSMDCQLLFADGGNGIQPEDVQTKLTMDYFKEKKLLQIHP